MSIIVDNISYTYEIGTGFEKQALKNVKCVINDGDFIGLIGHTGSGKSTFIQHLNGLVKATSGTIYFNGMDIYDKDFDMKMLRSKVGLVFQYPEHQAVAALILLPLKKSGAVCLPSQLFLHPSQKHGRHQ